MALCEDIKMKMFKCFSMLGLVALLSACGGHGFEGEYKAKSDAGMMGNVVSMMGADHITIGADFFEMAGNRTKMKDIFIRKSNGKEYLVFQTPSGQEDAWEIIDDNTLLNGQGGMNLTYIRQ